MNPSSEPVDQFRRARRRRTWGLVAAIGGIIAVLVLAFAAVSVATRTRTLVHRTFRTDDGHRVEVRIIDRMGRRSAHILWSAAGMRANFGMTSEFPAPADPSGGARIAFDAKAKELRMWVDDAELGYALVTTGGAMAFRPLPSARPKP